MTTTRLCDAAGCDRPATLITSAIGRSTGPKEWLSCDEHAPQQVPPHLRPWARQETERLDDEALTFLDALSAWLVKRGFAAQERGYGHVSGADLAEALVARYEMRLREQHRSLWSEANGGISD